MTMIADDNPRAPLMQPPDDYMADVDDVHGSAPHEWRPLCNEDPPCVPYESEPQATVPPTASPRAWILDEAKRLIMGDRNNQYGPPTEDFRRTAEVLTALGYHREDADGVLHDISPSDISVIVSCVKLSRLMHDRTKPDTWMDLAGYAACGYEVSEAEG